MKLIGTTSSPFVRKVRVAALERKLPLEFVIDNPMDTASRVPEFNPLGKVPALVLNDGSTLIDSALIVDYLDSLTDAPRLIPTAADSRRAVQQWEAVADGVLDAAVLIRVEGLRPESERSASWMEKQRGKIERGLEYLSRTLGEREFYVEDRYTLADIAVGCCIGYLEFRLPTGEWRKRFAVLARKMQRLEERASFRTTPMA